MGIGKFQHPPGAQKLLNGFPWNLEYITMSGVWPHMQIRMVLWRCNNVGGLCEDMTCHMVRFLKPLTHDLSLRPSRRGIFLAAVFTAVMMAVKTAIKRERPSWWPSWWPSRWPIVTVCVSRALVYLLTLYFWSRTARTGRPILTIYTSYDVFLHKEVPYGDCFPFSGSNPLKPKS